MARPLALTVGEPAGIGPDITFSAIPHSSHVVRSASHLI